MRVLFCGSRTWADPEPIEDIVHALAGIFARDLVIVHGAAPGADSIAGQVAVEANVRVEAHPADWKRHGRGAGPIRNQQMLDSGIDFGYAFRCHGQSRGTDDMIERLRKADVRYRVITEEN